MTCISCPCECVGSNSSAEKLSSCSPMAIFFLTTWFSLNLAFFFFLTAWFSLILAFFWSCRRSLKLPLPQQFTYCTYIFKLLKPKTKEEKEIPNNEMKTKGKCIDLNCNSILGRNKKRIEFGYNPLRDNL